MKTIQDLVNERLHINQNTSTEQVDITDPNNWVPGDILVGKYTYGKTNYHKGTKIIRFYKIISKKDTKLNLVELKKNILKGDKKNGICEPNLDVELEKDSAKIQGNYSPVTSDSFVLKYWNKNPIEYYKDL